MVVLAASIVSKSGKALVSRQYMDMSRIRIEGLLAAFPKLVGSGKQHTYVETENVRYVYQPMEGLYLLLVTNKNSNILEDLDTLRLLSKVVPDFAGSLEEDAVSRSAFDLIFAFDEVISTGHKEHITVAQVKQNCEMESHEEKLHKMIILSKINETKDVMKRKALEIEKTKVENKKAGGGGGGFGGGSGNASSYSSMGSKPIGMDLDNGMSGMGMQPSLGGVGGGGGGGGFLASKASAATRGPSKGMQLGKSSKANNILDSLAREGELMEDAPSARGGHAAAGAGPAHGTVVISEPVFITIEEKLSVLLDKEGGVENVEVQGTMSLVVSADEEAFVRVTTQSGANKGFQFKTHPNIDKNVYNSSGVLTLKDPTRPFPTGSELGILKWRWQSRDADSVPLTISCWPSQSGAESYVNIEYESASHLDLQNVVIAIPLPHGNHPPTVKQVDGDWRFDQRRSALLWTIDLVDDTNRSGSMEFVVPAADPETFYPIEVSFTSSKTICQMEIESVVNTQRDAPAKYGFKRGLRTEQYQVA